MPTPEIGSPGHLLQFHRSPYNSWDSGSLFTFPSGASMGLFS